MKKYLQLIIVIMNGFLFPAHANDNWQAEIRDLCESRLLIYTVHHKCNFLKKCTSKENLYLAENSERNSFKICNTKTNELDSSCMKYINILSRENRNKFVTLYNKLCIDNL